MPFFVLSAQYGAVQRSEPFYALYSVPGDIGQNIFEISQIELNGLFFYMNFCDIILVNYCNLRKEKYE